MHFGVRISAGDLALVQPVRVNCRADELPAAVSFVQRVTLFVVLGIAIERRLLQTAQVKGRENPVRGVGVKDHAAPRLVCRSQLGVSHGGFGGNRLELVCKTVILGLDFTNVGRLPTRRPDQQLSLAATQRFEELGDFRLFQVVDGFNAVFVLQISRDIKALLTHIGLEVRHQ